MTFWLSFKGVATGFIKKEIYCILNTIDTMQKLKGLLPDFKSTITKHYHFLLTLNMSFFMMFLDIIKMFFLFYKYVISLHKNYIIFGSQVKKYDIYYEILIRNSFLEIHVFPVEMIWLYSILQALVPSPKGLILCCDKKS